MVAPRAERLPFDSKHICSVGRKTPSLGSQSGSRFCWLPFWQPDPIWGRWVPRAVNKTELRRWACPRCHFVSPERGAFTVTRPQNGCCTVDTDTIAAVYFYHDQCGADDPLLGVPFGFSSKRNTFWLQDDGCPSYIAFPRISLTCKSQPKSGPAPLLSQAMIIIAFLVAALIRASSGTNQGRPSTS